MKTGKDAFRLNNGIWIPSLGFGTFKTPDAQAAQVVMDAIEVGYRHIDTAAVYENERGVGQGIKNSGIPREELFITSKLWNTERGYDSTLRAFDATMERLGLAYLDLYLIHWPANRKQFGDQAKEINAQTWKAFETLYRQGRIKAIGLSNFEKHHIEELMETCEIRPMVDQLEIHPGWMQEETVSFCQEKNIVVEAWSPLGRATMLGHPVLNDLAQKYGKNSAQICIRWILQKGLLPLPKTVHKERMVENADVFDFVLSKEDMARIDALKGTGGPEKKPDEVDF